MKLNRSMLATVVMLFATAAYATECAGPGGGAIPPAENCGSESQIKDKGDATCSTLSCSPGLTGECEDGTYLVGDPPNCRVTCRCKCKSDGTGANVPLGPQYPTVQESPF